MRRVITFSMISIPIKPVLTPSIQLLKHYLLAIKPRLNNPQLTLNINQLGISLKQPIIIPLLLLLLFDIPRQLTEPLDLRDDLEESRGFHGGEAVFKVADDLVHSHKDLLVQLEERGLGCAEEVVQVHLVDRGAGTDQVGLLEQGLV